MYSTVFRCIPLSSRVALSTLHNTYSRPHVGVYSPRRHLIGSKLFVLMEPFAGVETLGWRGERPRARRASRPARARFLVALVALKCVGATGELPGGDELDADAREAAAATTREARREWCCGRRKSRGRSDGSGGGGGGGVHSLRGGLAPSGN